MVLLHPALLAEAALQLADPAAGLDELLSVGWEELPMKSEPPTPTRAPDN